MTASGKVLAIGVLLLAAGGYALSQAPPAGPAPLEAPTVPVAEGWQMLLVDLEAMRWRGKPDTSSGDSESFASAWGSEKGIVSVLRIDPPGNSVFEFDRLELLQRTGPVPSSGEIFPFRGMGDPLFDRMRLEPDRQWYIADDRLLRTPESAHWMRSAIAREFPSAIVFPGLPSENDLARTTPGGWQLPVYWLAALFVAALAAPFAARLMTGAPRAAVEAASLPVLLISFVFLQPQLSVTLAALAGAAILAVAWLLSPKRVTPAVFGGGKAWAYLSPLLVVSVCAILFLPHRGTLDSPLWEVLATYFLWAMLQQYVIAVLFLERAKTFAGGSAVVVSAMVFSYLHFPNFALMMLTFLLGLYLLTIYLRHPNLPAIALTHALAAVSIELVAPRWFWLSREIGPHFLAAL